MKYEDLSETEKQPIRAAYIRLHKKYLDDDTFKSLSSADLVMYADYGKRALKHDNAKESIIGGIGLGLMVAFFVGIAFILPMQNSNGDIKPSKSSSSTSSSLTDSASSNSPEPDYDSSASANYADDTPPEEPQDCNANYSPCIPDSASDLDCADIGESVTVTGSDIYGLDRDGDGEGCESY